MACCCEAACHACFASFRRGSAGHAWLVCLWLWFIHSCYSVAGGTVNLLAGCIFACLQSCLLAHSVSGHGAHEMFCWLPSHAGIRLVPVCLGMCSACRCVKPAGCEARALRGQLDLLHDEVVSAPRGA